MYTIHILLEVVLFCFFFSFFFHPYIRIISSFSSRGVFRIRMRAYIKSNISQLVPFGSAFGKPNVLCHQRGAVAAGEPNATSSRTHCASARALSTVIVSLRTLYVTRAVDYLPLLLFFYTYTYIHVHIHAGEKWGRVKGLRLK